MIIVISMPAENPLSGSSAISVKWLLDHIEDENIVVFDCRCDIADHSAGRRMYYEGHIPGSYFLDMEEDLSGPTDTHGGRHPLPDPVSFTIRMGKTGVDETKTVIAYDEYGFAATRFWWLLKYYGFDNVLVLEGGYREWVEQGGMITDKIPGPVYSNFIPRIRHNLVCTRNQLREKLDRVKLIDSRSYERYVGRFEPFDFRAGHIPSATNIDFTTALSSPSVWKDRDELGAIFREIEGMPIVYCGSGVTATANIFALARIGIPSILYAGGWSDWISYEDAEIETGDPYSKGESFSL